LEKAGRRPWRLAVSAASSRGPEALETGSPKRHGQPSTDATVVDPDLAAQALALFDPVWEALVPRERVSLLQLLIERIDYDPKGVAITFRPAGLASLGAEQRSAA
jgi:hypothetical protein